MTESIARTRKIEVVSGKLPTFVEFKLSCEGSSHETLGYSRCGLKKDVYFSKKLPTDHLVTLTALPMS